MYCSRCGKEIPEGSAFCGYCGATAAEQSAEGVEGGTPPQPETPRPPAPPPVQQYAAAPPSQTLSPLPKKRRSALPWILGAVGIAAVVAVVLVLVFVVFAGEDGMSLSQYKKSVGDIHSGVGGALGDLSDDLEVLADWELTEDLQSAIGSFAAVGRWVDGALSVLEDGLQELEGTEPPPAAEPLQRELIAFYEDSMDTLGEMRDFALYMEGLLGPMARVIEEFEGLEAAISETATLEEVVAVVQGMGGAIATSLQELAAVSAPPDFAALHRQILSLWEELDTVMNELAAALEAEDLASIEELEARMGAWEAGWEDLGIEFEDFSYRFYDDLMRMADDGDDFMDRIEAL